MPSPKVEISQIEVETGKTIKVWRSVKEIEESEYYYGSIAKCCLLRKGCKTYNGYIWQRGDFTDKVFDTKSILDSKNSEHKKKIIGTNLKTGEIVKYDSISSVEQDGFFKVNVSQCCRGERDSHHGYRWKFEEEGVSKSISLKAKSRKAKYKVIQIDPITKAEKIFDTVMEAANNNESAASKIREVCKGDRITHAGFQWKWGEQI